MTTSLGINQEQKKKETTRLNEQEEKQVQKRPLEKEKQQKRANRYNKNSP